MAHPPEQIVDPTAFYRLFDKQDVLLYVGVSRNPNNRFKEHAHNQVWWHHVARTEIAWLDSWQEARDVEDATIRIERPLYNGTLHLGPEWRDPRHQYDSTADVAAMTDQLRVALQAGKYRKGEHLWGLRVGKDFGYSCRIASSVMDVLTHEGLLQPSSAGYWVT